MRRFLSPIIEAILFDDDIPPPPTIFEIADPSYLLSDNFPLLLVSFYSEDEEFLSLNFSRGNDSIHPARSSNSRQEGGRGCRGGGCTSLAQLPDSAPPRVIVEAHPPSIHPSRWNYCVWLLARLLRHPRNTSYRIQSTIRVNCFSLRIIEYRYTRVYIRNIFV